MSTEWFNIALTIINLIVAICLVLVTYQYTTATKRIVQLDEERKIWEVQPVIVPIDKIDSEMDYVRSHDQLGIPKKISRRVIGIKNIGRGIAKIAKLTSNLTRENEEWAKNRATYLIPIYLCVGEEFICSWVLKDSDVKDKKIKYEEIVIEADYTDIHGNSYSMSLSFGKAQIVRQKTITKTFLEST